jgi:uncharacterized protein (TIGR03083 family)
MDDESIFAASAVHRRELADLVESLDTEQLETRSLCTEWTVRVLVGHLIAPITTSAPKFLITFLRTGFRPNALNTRLAREIAAKPVTELAAALRANATKRFKPPVVGAYGPFTDLLVHGGDLRLPLGLPFDPPVPDVAVALEFLNGRAPGFVPRGRLTGLELAPTDLERTWGEGAEISGRAADLMMAVCGRPTVLPSLSGPGVKILADRLTRR